VPPDRVTVAADLAWLLRPVDSGFGEQTLRRYGLSNSRLVGVNINAEHALLATEPKLFQKLASLLDKLIESHDLRVVFLCNEIREGETYDKAAATIVQSHMRRKDEAIVLPNDYLTPQQMLSIIASCSLTVSTRYHFCLFSAIQAVPFLAIKRSDKVADLCDDLGWPFGALPGGLEVEELGRQAATLLSSGSQEVRDLPNRVEIMRERAWRNQIALDALDACASTASRLKTLRVAFDLYAREKTQDTL
jgi:polysaccharide pyruvyl transferase WcaK-like protein